MGRLSEIAVIDMGISPEGSSCNNVGDGLPLLNGPTEFGTHHPHPIQFSVGFRKKSRKDDLLFCVRGSTTGRMNWSDREYAIGRGICAIRHKQGAGYQQFIKAAIDYQLPSLLSQATGSTFPNVSRQQIEDIEIEIPPLPTQKAIAHILGSLDDKIELLRQMNETLEAMARALFKSWFVDFDPVRKKAEGLPTGLPPEIDALFPDSFEDSELGEIPKGWSVKPLSELFGFLPGYAFKSSDWKEDGIPVIKIGSVKPGFVDLTQVSYVSSDVAKDAERYRLQPGDLVIGMTGYVGEVGLIPLSANPPLLNQRVGKFILREQGTAELGFLYCLVRKKEFKASVEMHSHGTAQANVSSDEIMSITCVYPHDLLYGVFNELVKPTMNSLLANKNEMGNLEVIRDSLLPKLISGNLEVKDINKILEPAT